MDYGTRIIYSKLDFLPPLTHVEQVVPLLESLSSDPNTAEIMDVDSHERAFWPSHHLYIPDNTKRIETALQWLTDHGYKSVFLNEGFLWGRKQ